MNLGANLWCFWGLGWLVGVAECSGPPKALRAPRKAYSGLQCYLGATRDLVGILGLVGVEFC